MLYSALYILNYYYVKFVHRKHFCFKRNIKIPTKFSFKVKGKVIVNGDATLGSSGYFGVTSKGTLCIGDNVYFGRNILIACREKITIGDNCLFGPNVTIYDHDHLIKDGKTLHDHFVSKEVIVEKDCWIGAGVIILRGSHIGEGSVIGAGTVIKGVLPPHTLMYNKQEVVRKVMYK